MPRLAIGIEYDGSRFSGWQQQDHALSIQQTVAQAFSRVADEPVTVNGAGRTDAGVHALGQVAHFDTLAQRDLRSWQLGANSNLPPDVSIGWVREVPASFDARYSAIARTYRYVILNSPTRSALYAQRAGWIWGALDLAAMQAAAAQILGEHDFSAFRASQCQAHTPTRDLQQLDLQRRGSFILVTCRANAFLHHMVRNLVGSLVRIGRGDERPEWLREVLDGRDRRAAGITAAAAGLYLVRVHYPPELGIPEPPGAVPGDL